MTQTPTESEQAQNRADVDWDDPSTLPIAEVREVFVVLGKALRAHQLYDESNPVYQRFVSQFRETLQRVWAEMDRLPVNVDEDRFLWMGEVVYESASRTDSLAFLFFKDGIREFTIHQGLETHELRSLLRVLNRARDLRPEGDDLLTVLWEEDLQYFTYSYVDVLAEGLHFPEAGEGYPGGFEEILQEEVGEEAEAQGDAGKEEADGPATVSTDDFNPTLYSLDPLEMERVQEEIKEEMARDLRADVLAALFDRVEEPRFPERQMEILEIFQTLLPNLLSRGALQAAGSIVEEIVRLIASPNALKPEQRDHAERTLDEVSGSQTIRELIQSLEDGSISPDPRELAAFLRHLRAGALEPLLRGAEEAEDRGIKAIIQEAVAGISKNYEQSLLDCLGSADPVVAAGACRMAGKMRLASAASRVSKLLSHPDPRVRMAAVEAATGIRASTAMGGLQDALSDPEREVRIAAARALGVLRYAPAASRFRTAIESKAMRGADISEQIAFFESYGLIRDPGGVRLLDGLLNGRGFLGRKESGEIRACAALGLGKMGTPEARQALERARSEQDPVVRSAVNRALRREA